MPKKRRLLNTLSSAEKNKVKQEPREGEVWTARGRLKGALMEVLEPTAEDSDSSSDSRQKESEVRVKEEHQSGRESHSPSPPRQAYVLKLFDRSVDLSQFHEDSPLYPVCRAWIKNQPKASYSDLGDKEEKHSTEELVVLPPPAGPPVPRVPPLLPEQAASKENINLDYTVAPPPSRESLLQGHMRRWGGVRDAWLRQGQLCEARHAAAQEALNKLHVNTM